MVPDSAPICQLWNRNGCGPEFFVASKRMWFSNTRNEEIERRSDRIVFKILNGYENIKEERRTRGHEVTLANKQCRLDLRKFSFSQRTLKEWNIVSPDCVWLVVLICLKNNIDIYLRRTGCI